MFQENDGNVRVPWLSQKPTPLAAKEEDHVNAGESGPRRERTHLSVNPAHYEGHSGHCLKEQGRDPRISGLKVGQGHPGRQ